MGLISWPQPSPSELCPELPWSFLTPFYLSTCTIPLSKGMGTWARAFQHGHHCSTPHSGKRVIKTITLKGRYIHQCSCSRHLYRWIKPPTPGRSLIYKSQSHLETGSRMRIRSRGNPGTFWLPFLMKFLLFSLSVLYNKLGRFNTDYVHVWLKQQYVSFPYPNLYKGVHASSRPDNPVWSHSHTIHPIHCGNDIIIAKQPDKPSALICKRITAVVSLVPVLAHTHVSYVQARDTHIQFQ